MKLETYTTKSALDMVFNFFFLLDKKETLGTTQAIEHVFSFFYFAKTKFDRTGINHINFYIFDVMFEWHELDLSIYFRVIFVLVYLFV